MCGDGLSACSVFGQRPCCIASTILMTPATPAAAWRVADVRLDRAQPQRVAPRTRLAVGGEERLRLDRVPERGAGAVRLDGVDVGRRDSPALGQRLTDDRAAAQGRWAR